MASKNRFWGVYISLTLGALSIAAGTKGNPAMVSAGLIMILTSIAYQSAKKRKLGIKAPSATRICFESVLMLAVLYLSISPSNLKELIAIDPIPNLVIPAWCIVAYSYITFKRNRTVVSS